MYGLLHSLGVKLQLYEDGICFAKHGQEERHDEKTPKDFLSRLNTLPQSQIARNKMSSIRVHTQKEAADERL